LVVVYVTVAVNVVSDPPDGTVGLIVNAVVVALAGLLAFATAVADA
jgi:hypothetical protein